MLDPLSNFPKESVSHKDTPVKKSPISKFAKESLDKENQPYPNQNIENKDVEVIKIPSCDKEVLTSKAVADVGKVSKMPEPLINEAYPQEVSFRKSKRAVFFQNRRLWQPSSGLRPGL